MCHVAQRRGDLAQHREFTPPGQGQGRGFFRDFAPPSQVVRGGTAAPDATQGLSQLGPAATTRPVQTGAKFCQQGAKSPLMETLGEEHSLQLQVSETGQICEQDNFVAEKILGHFKGTKNSPSRDS